MTDDEVVHCHQCDWPLLRGQQYTMVYGLCEECGHIHMVGIVHRDVCAMDMALGEPRALTQQRRAAAAGMN